MPVVRGTPAARPELPVPMDQVQPTAISPTTMEEMMLNRRSDRSDIPLRCHRLCDGSGKLAAQSPTVDHRCSKVELDDSPCGIPLITGSWTSCANSSRTFRIYPLS